MVEPLPPAPLEGQQPRPLEHRDMLHHADPRQRKPLADLASRQRPRGQRVENRPPDGVRQSAPDRLVFVSHKMKLNGDMSGVNGHFDAASGCGLAPGAPSTLDLV